MPLALAAAALLLCSCGGASGSTASSQTTTSAPPRVSHRLAPCVPAHVRLLASAPEVQVYAKGHGPPTPLPIGRGNPPVFVCSRVSHRRTMLSAGGQETVGPIRISGPFVGYATSESFIDVILAGVAVTDAGSGRRLHNEAATSEPNGVEADNEVRSLVIDARGGIAWIALKSSLGTHSSTFEVHRADTHGSTLLQSGPDIRPQSLRLAGATITWQAGASSQSAPLD
jgi:hypothetical protein